LVGQDEGSWRVGLDVSVSRGLSGGHLETQGVTADGMLIEVAEHAHHVDLDLARYEVSLSRTFNGTWDAVFRLPYFIKDQTASVEFSGDVSAEDRAAAIRNGFIHHRTATYEGFSDAELSAGWRKLDPLGEGSTLRISLGLTLPFGETEPNPWVLGDAGLVHNHIQFGNGTVDPLLDFYLGVPISAQWAFSIYGRGRFPFYENSHGYRGSIEAALIPRVTWLPNKKFSITTGLSADYYGYSYWSGERDENSGQFSLNASVSAGMKLTDSVTASIGTLLPVYTKSYGSEDALDSAPVFTLSLARQF
jgi:hypothetical protein